MTTVLDILNAGFNRSIANDRGKLATDAEIIAHLNRRYQGYFALMAAAAPDAYMAKVVQALAASTLTLPADIISLQHVETPAGVKVHVVPAHERSRPWHIAPRVYRVGRSLTSVGLPGDPAAADTLHLFILDAPATLAAVGDVLDARWPVRHCSLLELDVAIYLSLKDEGRSDRELIALMKERATDLEAFYALNGIQTASRESPHEQVAKLLSQAAGR